MRLLFNWIDSLYIALGFSAEKAATLGLLTNAAILIALAFLLDFLFKKILVSGLTFIAQRTKSNFDDFLVTNKTAKYAAHLFPLYFIYKTVISY